MHARNNWVEAKLGHLLTTKLFIHLETADLSQLMPNPYVVIRDRVMQLAWSLYVRITISRPLAYTSRLCVI